ncbi:MAG: hypothetical protein QOI80_1625 [Solirubrobacteraceae bacterium]|jgi:low temperature requirement protein LtrA|nr:hypothetical protein [Solirubrobacteraceae bacterium]
MAIARGDAEERVTNLELFFDLVFVFAITQVTTLMAHEPTWAGLGQGMLVLSALWFAWASFAWLTNTLNPEEGPVRLAIFATMAMLLVCSLAVPRAFGDDGVLFGVTYLMVRVMHLALYAIAARGDTTLWVVVRNLMPGMLGAAGLILAAGFADGTLQALLWVLAIAIEVSGPLIVGVDGWRVHPGHFAERHSLFMIIALGESIVAAGVAIGGMALDAELIAAAVLGIVVVAGLWWTYFDVGVHVAAHRLTAAEGAARSRLARDSWTFFHLPMVAGILLFALGVKKALGHLDEPLPLVPAAALCGGIAVYFVGQVLFRIRNVRTFSVRRAVTAAALLAAIPLAHAIDALYALAVTAALVWSVIIYEVVRYRANRQSWIHPEEAIPA